MDGVKAISAFVSKEMFSSGNGKACFTYAKEHENKLNRGEKQSGKRAGIAGSQWGACCHTLPA
jgi:hypothetical protein